MIQFIYFLHHVGRMFAFVNHFICWVLYSECWLQLSFLFVNSHSIFVEMQNDQQTAAAQEEDFAKDYYGNMKMIQSVEKLERDLLNIKDINGGLDGEKVWVRGRFHTSRGVGKFQAGGSSEE